MNRLRKRNGRGGAVNMGTVYYAVEDRKPLPALGEDTRPVERLIQEATMGRVTTGEAMRRLRKYWGWS